MENGESTPGHDVASGAPPLATHATHAPSAATDTHLVAREAGGTWAASVVHGGLRFVAAFLTARILGVADFGTLSLAVTITGLGSVVAGLGLSPGILPFLSRARRAGEDRVAALVRAAMRVALPASLAVAAAAFVAAPWLAGSVFANPDLAGVLQVLAPLIVLGAVTGVFGTFLQGLLAVKERAWIENVVVTGSTAIVLALAWFAGWGRPGVLVAMLAGPGIGLVAAAGMLARRAPGALAAPPPDARFAAGPLLAYSWPLLGSSMMLFLLMWSDILLMGVFREPGEVGVYGLCARLVTAVLMVHEAIGQVFLARLSDLFVAGDRSAMRHLYHLSSRWGMWPAMVVAWALILWGPEILGLFGPDFEAGARPLAVLAAAKAVSACSGMSGRVFAVTGRARLNLANAMLMVVGNIVLNLLWIPRFGALGAAAATLVSIAFIKSVQVAQVAVLYRLLPWDRRSLVPIVGVSALAAAAAAVPRGPGGAWGWLVVLAGFTLASGGLFLARGVTEDEREVWRTIRGVGNGAVPS